MDQITQGIEVHHGVVPEACGEDEGVGSATTIEDVTPAKADDRLALGSAEDRVIGLCSDDQGGGDDSRSMRYAWPTG